VREKPPNSEKGMKLVSGNYLHPVGGFSTPRVIRTLQDETPSWLATAFAFITTRY